MQEVWIILAISYFMIINGIGFIIMGLDKRKAIKHQWRIPERNLLFVAFIGGGLGSLFGMWVFRHKTKHTKFTLLIPISVLVYFVILLSIFRG